MAKNSSTEIVKDDESNVVATTAPTAVSNNPMAPREIYYSGVIETFSDRLNFAANVLGNSEPISEHVGEIIELHNFAFQPVKIVTDDGEEIDDIRTYLIGKNETGEDVAYRATSMGIRSSLNDIVSVIGEPQSWPAPVRIKMVGVNLPGAHRTYRLSIVL